mmetsp:Transcript_2038/g.7954  ORF Transcript_2038/g.7954 Transcript_2038/m.7954 type:complete len:215 (-) Transcript_2038:433-1077(-)
MALRPTVPASTGPGAMPATLILRRSSSWSFGYPPGTRGSLPLPGVRTERQSSRKSALTPSRLAWAPFAKLVSFPSTGSRASSTSSRYGLESRTRCGSQGAALSWAPVSRALRHCAGPCPCPVSRETRARTCTGTVSATDPLPPGRGALPSNTTTSPRTTSWLRSPSVRSELSPGLACTRAGRGQRIGASRAKRTAECCASMLRSRMTCPSSTSR